jgi:pyruvate/oxaloacetate carboxyltransferase
LEEIVQVRADLGYPIMVTPFAQFVGSQAAINVVTGERYKEVTDQVSQYGLGLSVGKAPNTCIPKSKQKFSTGAARASWRPSKYLSSPSKKLENSTAGLI